MYIYIFYSELQRNKCGLFFDLGFVQIYLSYLIKISMKKYKLMQLVRVQIPSLSLMNFVILNKLLNISVVFWFLYNIIKIKWNLKNKNIVKNNGINYHIYFIELL